MNGKITEQINLIEESLKWAEKFKKESFPTGVFKEYRRELKKIRSALDCRCSAAAYGESQVGKSYLMGSLLSSPDVPFMIESGEKKYSFVDDINPSGGGKTSKVESTGIITRFSLSEDEESTNDSSSKATGRVKAKLLSVVDIILLIADSYYNDIKLDVDKMLKSENINEELIELSSIWKRGERQNDSLDEDDVKDINQYIREVIGIKASHILNSQFCEVVAPLIQNVPYNNWVDIFSLLWNKNEHMSRLFSVLINAYKRLKFQTQVYLPFDAVLKDKGTILKISWLDQVCNVNEDMNSHDEPTTDVYDCTGKLLAEKFSKGELSALIAELTFQLPRSIAKERKFLEKIDLLDFPGARSREVYKEAEIEEVLHKILRRGKVAYLFNKYSRSLMISSVLFCHHNDQKADATIGETINSWIEDNIGKTPSERANMLSNTNGIAPLFMIATKFNCDLKRRAKADIPDKRANLDEHWERFDKVIPEIVKPNKWLAEWVDGTKNGGVTAFQNIYPLRDFFFSKEGEGNLFCGYSDGSKLSAEISEYVHEDYPQYMSDLRESFLAHPFVRTHFADPSQTWSDVATVGNDGSKAIIRSLNNISGCLEEARVQKYMPCLSSIARGMYSTLATYYEPEDDSAKNEKIRKITGEIRRSFMGMGKDPSMFGRIIDSMMIPVCDMRSIAYDIVCRGTEKPRDFSTINIIRAQVDINVNDAREVSIQKLLHYYNCTSEAELQEDLSKYECTVEDVISSTTGTLTTVAAVVTKHIVDYWKQYLTGRTQLLDGMLSHSSEVVGMLVTLLDKLEVSRVIESKINEYSRMFALSEQPNAIADFSALTLNNFVSSVGRNYIRDEEIGGIKEKATKCDIDIDVSEQNVGRQRKREDLRTVLEALEESTQTVNQPSMNMTVLRKLPLWDNYLRWLNLVVIGLLYSSDVSQCDPIANGEIKQIMDRTEELYK